jgi:hypothetical protein
MIASLLFARSALVTSMMGFSENELVGDERRKAPLCLVASHAATLPDA